MPTLKEAMDAATYLMWNPDRWRGSVRGHIAPKHSSLEALQNWMRDRPNDAMRHQQGYGNLTYFTNQAWGFVDSLIAEALNKPTSVHAAAGDRDRAIFYRDYGNEVIGMAFTQNTPPRAMEHLFQMNGVIVVIDVFQRVLITAFPSMRPTTAVLT